MKAGIALAILAAIALPIVLLVVYAEAVSTWLGQFLPARAEPIPALLFALFFAMTAWIALSNWRQARASATWPSVAGRITRSDVVKEMLYPGTARRGTKVPGYKPVVEFEYVVDGKTYRTDHVQFGATVIGQETDARARLAPYPLGRELPVRYDPQRPQTAVLTSAIAYPARTTVMTVAFGLLALYFGGAF